MNCFNSGKFLKEAIDSVFIQTYDNWEIIFWDNNSTDNSAEIAQSYDSRLRYFKADETVPLYHARNFALEKAEGEFIAFLDCDDLWEKDKLEKQILLFENPEVGVVYSDARYFRSDSDFFRLYEKRPFYTGDCRKQLIQDYFLCLQTLVIRKTALDELDYFFDLRFQIIGDAETVRRISLNDWHLAMVPEVLAHWRIHGNNLTLKRPMLIEDETLQMLEKFNEIYPGFNSEYQNEIAILKEGIAIHKAKAYLKDGRSSEVRKIVQEYLPHKKALFCYGVSLMPSFLREFVVEKVFKN